MSYVVRVGMVFFTSVKVTSDRGRVRYFGVNEVRTDTMSGEEGTVNILTDMDPVATLTIKVDQVSVLGPL